MLGGSVIIGNIVRKAEAGVVRQSKEHQALHHGQTVPAEPRILFRIHAHRRQADDDHGRGVGVRAGEGVAVNAALAQLGGQIVHSLVDGRLHPAVAGIERQSRQHVGSGVDGSPLIPTAVRLLRTQQRFHQLLFVVLCSCEVRLIVGRQRIRRTPSTGALVGFVQQRDGVERRTAVGRRIQLGRIHTVSGQRQDRLVVGRIRGSRRLYGSDRRVDVILLGRFRQRHALIRIGSGVGAHIHRPPVGSAFGIGRCNGIHYLHWIREQLFQRGVDLRVAPERHLLQRFLLCIAGEINGVAHDRQIRSVGLCAVAGGILHGDLVVQPRYHAVQLSGEAAVIALRGCADDGRRYGCCRRQCSWYGCRRCRRCCRPPVRRWSCRP